MADWPAPDAVVAFTTTRQGGLSVSPYESLNVGDHVGDIFKNVVANRQCLQRYVGRHVRLLWLKQVHGANVVNCEYALSVPEADASVAGCRGYACVVMTADCIPVLLCNHIATKVAALHCGWPGLYQGLIKKTLAKYFANDRVMAWLGPAIGQYSYEVDARLYDKFGDLDSSYQRAFINHRRGHYLLDLYAIARQQLVQAGLVSSDVYGGGFDTFTDTRFYSYRRRQTTGRMASVIYLR